MINGLFVICNGLVLMSLCIIFGVIVVDKESGKVIWYVGLEVVVQQYMLVEMENGLILVFDNGNLCFGVILLYFMVLEFDLQIKVIIWQYCDIFLLVFFLLYMGSVQWLVNGNIFICELVFGCLFEVILEGEMVWEYIILFFNEYLEYFSKGIISGKQNSVFCVYCYVVDVISWLK